MGWGQFLLWATGPVVIRVLATLGLGVVTYTGFTAIVTLAQQHMQTNFNGLPADAMQLLFLSGVPQAISMILSALTIRAGMMQLSKIQRLV